jgi:predicted murein hydrolase (TIGR00659 family)
MSAITANVFFGFVLTLAAYFVGYKINQKYARPWTTPLLLATVIVIAVLLAFKIPYDDYNIGAKYLNYFLVPVTVCFAVPMYRQLPLLKKHAAAILVSLFVGCIASVLTVIGLVALFGVGDIIARSLVSISISTAIAIGVTEALGGLVPLTVFAVVITGVLGAAVGDVVCRVFGITSPIAKGLAIGNASHAAGTAKALEMGRVEGAMSSLAIVVSGLMTVLIAPMLIEALVR